MGIKEEITSVEQILKMTSDHYVSRLLEVFPSEKEAVYYFTTRNFFLDGYSPKGLYMKEDFPKDSFLHDKEKRLDFLLMELCNIENCDNV